MGKCPTCGVSICEVCKKPISGEFHYIFDGVDYCQKCADDKWLVGGMGLVPK